MVADVTAALIGAGGTLAGAAVGWFATWRATRTQVDAENARFRGQHAEDARLVRQDAYQRMLTLMEKREAMIRKGAPITRESLTAFNEELNRTSATVRLIGSPSVREGLAKVNAVVGQVKVETDRLKEQSHDPWVKRATMAWEQHRAEIELAEEELATAMREDVRVRGEAALGG
jgi:hypothetical protein